MKLTSSIRIVFSLCLAVTMIFSSATILAKKAEPNPKTMMQASKEPAQPIKPFLDYIFDEAVKGNLTFITQRLVPPKLIEKLKDFDIRPEHLGPNGILVITNKTLEEAVLLFKDVPGTFQLCSVPKSRGGGGGLAGFTKAACGGSGSATSGSTILGGGKSMSAGSPGFNVFTSECGGSGSGGGSSGGSSATAGSGSGDDCRGGGGGSGSGGGSGGSGGGSSSLADFQKNMNDMFCGDSQHVSGSIAAGKMQQVSEGGPGDGWVQGMSGEYYSPAAIATGLAMRRAGAYLLQNPGSLGITGGGKLNDAINALGGAFVGAGMIAGAGSAATAIAADNAAIRGMPRITDGNGDTWARSSASGQSFLLDNGEPTDLMIDGKGNVYDRDPGNGGWKPTGQTEPVPQAVPPPSQTANKDTKPAEETKPPAEEKPPEEKKPSASGGTTGGDPSRTPRDDGGGDGNGIGCRGSNCGTVGRPTIPEGLSRNDRIAAQIRMQMILGMGVTNPGEMGAGRFGFGGGVLSPCMGGMGSGGGGSTPVDEIQKQINEGGGAGVSYGVTDPGSEGNDRGVKAPSNPLLIKQLEKYRPKYQPVPQPIDPQKQPQQQQLNNSGNTRAPVWQNTAPARWHNSVPATTRQNTIPATSSGGKQGKDPKAPK